MRTATWLAVTCALLLAHAASAQQVEMSWNIDPRSQTHLNQQTKLAFRGSVAGFRLEQAKTAQTNGAATFAYRGKHGSISIIFAPRAVVGCGPGQDCVSPAMAAQIGQLKSAHGKYDMQESSSLRGVGRARGQRQMYRFVASRELDGKPAYAETGAFEIGAFVYAYRATFTDKAGLEDLAVFLRAFGVAKAA